MHGVSGKRKDGSGRNETVVEPPCEMAVYGLGAWRVTALDMARRDGLVVRACVDRREPRFDRLAVHGTLPVIQLIRRGLALERYRHATAAIATWAAATRLGARSRTRPRRPSPRRSWRLRTRDRDRPGTASRSCPPSRRRRRGRSTAAAPTARRSSPPRRRGPVAPPQVAGDHPPRDHGQRGDPGREDPEVEGRRRVFAPPLAHGVSGHRRGTPAGTIVMIGEATGSSRKSVANSSLAAVRSGVPAKLTPHRVRRLTNADETMFAYPASNGDPNRTKLATRYSAVTKTPSRRRGRARDGAAHRAGR